MTQFRFIVLITSVTAAYLVLVFNIYTLQIKKGLYYSARAQSQYQLAGFLEPHRGAIYFTDKNNNQIPTAVNKSYDAIFAVPKAIQDLDKAVENLAPILNLDQEELRKKLSKNNLYELLVKKATPEQVTKVSELKIKGIYVDAQDWRYYPFNNLAAHILGYVGFSEDENKTEGKYGVERYFNDLLSGQPGIVNGQEIIKPTQGTDIVLTIDRNIQVEAEDTLKKLVEEKEAVGGTIIVQEPETGKILALANWPDFDPNNYSQSDLGHFINPAVQSIYEPGSVFKVITMAAGLDSGKITPQTTYYDSGVINFPDGKKIQNWDLKAHGQITMSTVIEQSINTGSAFVESKIGHRDFYQYLNQFGFEDKTSINLPGEVAGNLRNVKNYQADIDLASASFGQGIAVTPLQLISAISAIANQGKLMSPFIVANEEPKEVRQVISPEAAQATTKMMVSAVRKAGIAQIPNYLIAGKTGTAQVPDFKKGGYTKDVINTYAGFAPASDPKFTVLVKLDKPAGAPLAGTTVVPTFRDLAQFILNYYNIRPDDLKES